MVVTKLTPEVLKIIPSLIELETPLEDIAKTYGVKISSLKVVCSRHGISLRKGGFLKPRRPPPEEPLVVKLDDEVVLNKAAFTNMRRAASTRGISYSRLAAKLFQVIASEDLFDSVLDDKEGNK